MRKLLPAIGLAVAMSALILPAHHFKAGAAEALDSDRYTMSPVDGGFVRLDKKTGAMSLCGKSNDTWTCEAMKDNSQELREQLDALRAENADLKDEIRRMEEVFGLNGKRDGEGRPGPQANQPPGEFNLPSEQDVDKAIDYLEGMIRKFRERFEDFGDKTDPDKNPPKEVTPL